jgi:hypothetical protein
MFFWLFRVSDRHGFLIAVDMLLDTQCSSSIFATNDVLAIKASWDALLVRW